MSRRLAHIVRHPIKSIGWEEMAEVALSAGAVLPHDRRWAVAHEAAAFAGDPDGWQAKRNFVRGVAGPALMAVRAAFDEGAQRVRLDHPDRPALDIAPEDPADSAQLVDWLAPLWPETRPAAARLVTAGLEQALTDSAAPFVSLLSLASLRVLGGHVGKDLSVHRFRGNLWFDGGAPWEETGWIGREISVGSARLRIEEPITRCNATAVDPATGTRDIDMLSELKALTGKCDFGVYATVIEGGTARPGDEVTPI